MNRRRYRVLQEPDNPQPWVVQGAGPRAETWVDLARFHEADDAHRYVQQVAARQQKNAARQERRFER